MRTAWLHAETTTARTVPRIPCKVSKVLMLLALSKLKSPGFLYSVQFIARRSGCATDVWSLYLRKNTGLEAHGMCKYAMSFLEMCKATVIHFILMVTRVLTLAVFLTAIAVLQLQSQHSSSADRLVLGPRSMNRRILHKQLHLNYTGNTRIPFKPEARDQ